MPPEYIPAQDTAQPPTTANPVAAPPPPKRKIPKVAIIVSAVILLIIIILLVLRLVNRGSSENTVTWWGLWEDETVLAPIIAKYEAEHPGVNIEYVKQSPQDYRERLTNAMARGQAPDIFRFHNTWTPMFRNDLDALPSGVMNSADYAKTFYPIASSDLTLGSNIVGIPLEYDALTLYINEDIFNKSGKSAPATWDDLRLLARELTVKNDQNVITQSGIAMGRTENVDHWQEILALLMIQNGVDLSNPTGKTAEDALVFFTVFSLVDGVWDASLPSSTQAFAAGKVAMYIGPSWRAFEISLQNPNLKYKTVPIPQLPKDNPSQPDITYATYWAEGVWAKSDNKAQAWDFLSYLSSQEALQEFYTNASKIRTFGEPYPRPDMANLLVSHPVVGSIVSQAPGATSWYLASRTFDGPTGINSQLATYFGDAVNAVASGETQPVKALETLVAGVTQVLTQYRLVAR